MPAELQVNALVLAVAVIWGASLVLQGFDMTPELFKPFSTVCGAVVLLLAHSTTGYGAFRFFKAGS
jgi:hypothetical protein